MALVEETAAYLDGPGRKESKKLERGAALAYATESMRLTTRLMQLASWLLLHRAVKEGEMSLAQANKEKAKVKLSAGEYGDEQSIKLLPERLHALINRSKELQSAVRRLDATIHAAPDRARSNRQSGRAAAWLAQGGLRAGREYELPARSSLRKGDSAGACHPDRRFAPVRSAPLRVLPNTRPALFLSFLRNPENFFWKRDSRPPRSRSCCCPPVQAGCDFGSMSRRIVSPSLPQVVRVVNSVPSVIMILMVW